MAINFLPNPVYRFKDLNDNPLVGGLVFTYNTGTTDKQTTWLDKEKVGAHTNPIILDSRGEAEIWFDGILDLVTAPVGDTDPPSSPIKTVTGAQSSIDPVITAQSGLVLNLSFEEDADNSSTFTNWTANPAGGSTIQVDAIIQSDGSNSAEFVAGVGGGGSLVSDFIAVTANGTLSLNGMIISNGTSLSNLVKVAFYDKDKVAVATPTIYNSEGASTTTWSEWGGTVIANSISVWAKVELHGSSGGAGTVHFDRITMTQEKDTDFSTIEAHRGMALNSMFDRGIKYPRHWILNPSAAGSIIITTATQGTGANSLEFISTDGSGAGYAETEFIPITAGHILVCEAILKSSVITLTNTITFRYYDSARAFVSSVIAYTSGGVSTTTFDRIIASDSTPSTAHYVVIRIEGSTVTAGTVQFDRLHVTDELDDSLKYVRVTRASSQSILTATNTLINFDTSVSDDWGTHDTVTNNTRIVVPSWAKFARAKCRVGWTSTFGTSPRVELEILHSVISNVAKDIYDGDVGNSDTFSADSGWLVVDGAGYFTAQVFQNDGASRSVDEDFLYFEVEFRAK